MLRDANYSEFWFSRQSCNIICSNYREAVKIADIIDTACDQAEGEIVDYFNLSKADIFNNTLETQVYEVRESNFGPKIYSKVKRIDN